MLKIKTFGYKESLLATLPRIEQGLIHHGVDLNSNRPDIVYHNNGFYEDVLDYCKALDYKPFKIFCLLDIAEHNPGWPYKKAKEQLAQADVICAISETVKKQIQDKLGFEKVEVIYQPIKDVTYLNYAKTLEFLYVGRAFDPNKRCNLMVSVLNLIKFPLDNLIIVGPDNPSYGYYAGIIGDEELNVIYNSSKYVFLLSKFEGLALTAIESVTSGAIPILCNDNPIVKEFKLEDFAANPDPVSIAQKLEHMVNNNNYYVNKLNELRPGFLEKFDKFNVAKRIIDIYYKYHE